VGEPATKDCSRPKVLLFSSDGTYAQAIRPTIAPSGKGTLPSRYALIAMSFARTARISLRSPASCATETPFQSRYPFGISFTKIGPGSCAVTLPDGVAVNAAIPANVATTTNNRT